MSATQRRLEVKGVVGAEEGRAGAQGPLSRDACLPGSDLDGGEPRWAREQESGLGKARVQG